MGALRACWLRLRDLHLGDHWLLLLLQLHRGPRRLGHAALIRDALELLPEKLVVAFALRHLHALGEVLSRRERERHRRLLHRNGLLGDSRVASLLHAQRVARVALALDLRKQVPLAAEEEGVFENLVVGALRLRLVEVVHVQLPDEGREIAVLEVLR